MAVELQHREVTSLHIDRGYLGGELIEVYDQAGVVIVCKPWPVRNTAGHFSKLDFQIDLMTLQATCPAGQVVSITPGKTAHLPANSCQVCALRSQCTSRKSSGRTLTIHPQEPCCNASVSSLPQRRNGRRYGSASRSSIA